MKKVQSFLGFCNFYRRFIKEYKRIAKPLNELTYKDKAFEWIARCQKSFDAFKNFFFTLPIFRHFDFEKKTRLKTDALNGVMAKVLA